MVVELINTGNELLLGRILNTNQQWLCRELADRGRPVSRQISVGDSAEAIRDAAAEALSRADLVITTGGLGPTTDDLTRDVIARMLGRTLREDPVALSQIEHFFAVRNRPMPAATRTEALVPEGAFVLPNRYGTAPGFAMEIKAGAFRPNLPGSWLIVLPGPPRELQPMFFESVVPLLDRVLPPFEAFACRTVRTIGIGESAVQERVQPSVHALVSAGLEVGYCARPGQVDVRLAARGPAAGQLVADAADRVLANTGPACFGYEDDTIEGVVTSLLIKRNETLALAESCTGGLIAHRLTNIPGASAVVMGGFVTYSNAMKESALEVGRETLDRHGAVSEPVARQMAEGARQRANSTYALAVTGIAGPSGGTEERPVGTVFIALATPAETLVWKHLNPWDRATFKDVTATQALNYLRLQLAPATLRNF